MPNALQILQNIPSWSLCLPLAMANSIDTFQNTIHHFTLPEPILFEDIYLIASHNFPNDLFEHLFNIIKSQLKNVIMAKQL